MLHKHLLQKLLIVAIFATLVSSCFKDTGTRTYKLYTPVYQTTQTVRAAIKNDAPQPITSVGKMVLYGNYIFLNELNRGIHIIDNANPRNPINKAFIKIPGNENLAIKDNMLFADCYTDLLAIDITNADNIVLKNAVDNLFPERRYINGYQMYFNTVITDWLVKDTTVNIVVEEGKGIWTKSGSYLTAAPWGWAFASGTASSATSTTGINGSTSKYAIVNNFLYALSGNKINTVSIIKTDDPKLVNTTTNNGSIETIFPLKDKLFIGAQAGMFIYSISNPAAPVELGKFVHARVCDPVIADGNIAYVTLHSSQNRCIGFTNQLDVVDISNVSQPTIIKTYNLTSPYGLSKDSNLLFICDGAAGLKVFDATTATNITLKQTLASDETYDVIAFNGIAYVTAKDGLYQYSYANTNNVQLISKTSIVK